MLEWCKVESGSEAAARYGGKYCDSEVDLTYELFAWYEPLRMIDLMIVKLELCMKVLWMNLLMLLMTIVVGCESGVEERKWE